MTSNHKRFFCFTKKKIPANTKTFQQSFSIHFLMAQSVQKPSSKSNQQLKKLMQTWQFSFNIISQNHINSRFNSTRDLLKLSSVNIQKYHSRNRANRNRKCIWNNRFHRIANLRFQCFQWQNNCFVFYMNVLQNNAKVTFQ